MAKPFVLAKSSEEIFMLPQMSNRHGLVAGATGTGKTVTLRVMAEHFSELGVPVFMADVKGDLAGMADAASDPKMMDRAKKMGLTDYSCLASRIPRTSLRSPKERTCRSISWPRLRCRTLTGWRSSMCVG